MNASLPASERVKQVVSNYKGRKENILGMLLELQRASDKSYIDSETASLLAKELKMSETRVFEIISYYAMLRDKPTAKYVLEVCNSSPCHFSKADEVVAMLKDILGVAITKPTEDGMFVYQYTPCVGACDIGPVIKVNDKVFGNLTKEKVQELIDGLRSGTISV